jgi:Rrf2 family protein
MLSSSRFVMTIHALSVLAKNTVGAPVCSTYIAKSVRTNPVVIRRLMAELERNALVTSTSGRSGGFSLARHAKVITLADIYHAVEDENVFRMHKLDPTSDCPVAAQMGKALSKPLCAAHDALTAELSRTTLHDIAEAIH